MALKSAHSGGSHAPCSTSEQESHTLLPGHWQQLAHCGAVGSMLQYSHDSQKLIGIGNPYGWHPSPQDVQHRSIGTHVPHPSSPSGQHSTQPGSPGMQHTAGHGSSGGSNTHPPSPHGQGRRPSQDPSQGLQIDSSLLHSTNCPYLSRHLFCPKGSHPNIPHKAML